MKNVFTEADKNEILERIEKLTPESKALWGTMDVSQMLAHCVYAVQMPTGEIAAKRVGFPLSFVGGLLKSKMLAEGALPKNSPTATEIKVTDHRDFQKEKANFIAAFKKLADGGESGVKATQHPFFGKMLPAEWGRLNYKHLDHHLKQFGV